MTFQRWGIGVAADDLFFFFFLKKYLTFSPGCAIIMTERERTRKEDKKMAYGYYEAHEAEWEAMQEYLQNPED